MLEQGMQRDEEITQAHYDLFCEDMDNMETLIPVEENDKEAFKNMDNPQTVDNEDEEEMLPDKTNMYDWEQYEAQLKKYHAQDNDIARIKAMFDNNEPIEKEVYTVCRNIYSRNKLSDLVDTFYSSEQIKNRDKKTAEEDRKLEKVQAKKKKEGN